jgi:hypothetical protein
MPHHNGLVLSCRERHPPWYQAWKHTETTKQVRNTYHTAPKRFQGTPQHGNAYHNLETLPAAFQAVQPEF